MKVRYLGWVMWLAFVLVLGTTTYYAFNPVTGDPIGVIDAVWAWSFIGFPTTGALIVARFPRRGLGWLFCSGPLVLMMGIFLGDVAAVRGTSGSTAQWAAWAAGIMFSVGLALLLLIPFFLPDGSLSKGLSRIPFKIVVACEAIWFATATFAPGPLEEFPAYTNPVGVEFLGAAFEFSKDFVGLIMFGAIATAFVSIVLRFRRSQGQERLQLKWVALGAGTIVLVIGAIVLIERFVDLSDFQVTLFFVIVILALPVSIGTAMLRHQLFEIDQIINRTLVYSMVTAALVAAYLGLVVAFQSVLAPVTEDSDVAVAASTLAVAALFRPLRARMQGLIDRRFYRRKYDASRSIAAFSARLRDEVDIEVVRRDVLHAVKETVQPAHASLWLKAQRSGG